MDKMTLEERKIVKENTGLDYDSLHRYLRKTFGRADYCSNPECKRISFNYDWALLKGRNYSKNIEDYHPLCKSCHMKYDETPEKGRKVSEALTGRPSETNGFAKIVLNTATGIYYGTVKEAAISANMVRGTLSSMLTGERRNKTPFIYV